MATQTVQTSGTGVTTAQQVPGVKGFEGFLKSAGHLAGVLLSDLVKYALPITTVVVPVQVDGVSGSEAVFLAALRMVVSAVLAIEQKWTGSGSEANGQRLADVLQLVEAPIVAMFAQAGMAVDAVYVTELIDGVVALLNAQPAISIATSGISGTSGVSGTSATAA